MKKYSQFLKELPSKSVVFAFGRFNPPTIGHELLVKAVKKLAATNKADHAIYASKSQDAKKNPLSVDKKVHYLNLMFPNTHFVAASTDVPTFIQAAKQLNKKYKNIIMVAGSDRIPEYQRILNTYNGKEFHFDTIQVISAGERDPDADDASGMSASKMRTLASKGDYNGFKKGLPSTMRELDGRRLMNDVRQGMGLDVVKEQINLVKDELREQYFRGEIFNIGDIVESSGVQYEIVKRGSNHLLLKEESGELVSKWLQDVTPAQEIHLEETMIPEELTDKTLKTQDKIKVARIIATMLGIDNAETSANPDQLVNSALRKVRSKNLNPEALNILTKMLQLATEVGIKYDNSLVPSKLKECEEIDKSSTYNAAKDRLRYKDYAKLAKMNKGVTEETEQLDEISNKLAGNYYAAVVKQHMKVVGGVRHNMYDRMEKDIGKKRKAGVDRALDRITGARKTNEEVTEATDLRAQLQKHSDAAIAANKAGDDEKVKHHMNKMNAIKNKMAKQVRNEDVEIDEATTPYWKKSSWIKKMSQAAKQERLAREKKEAEEKKQVKEATEPMDPVCEDCGQVPCVCDDIQVGANNAKGFDPFFKESAVDMSEYEEDYGNNIGDEEISDEELDAMAAEVNDLDDVIDAYDEHELAIIDADSGEEVEEEPEEKEVNEQVIMEVLSRMERMKAKMRIRRTKAKRERKMQIALKRYSDNKTINKRARRMAVKLMKKRLLRGRDATKISVGEKERIERVIERRKKVVGRLAMRLAPRMRKIEKARMSHSKFTQAAPTVAM